MKSVLPWLSRRLVLSCRNQQSRTSFPLSKIALAEIPRSFHLSSAASQDHSPFVTSNAYSLRRLQALRDEGLLDYPRLYKTIEEGVPKYFITTFKKEFSPTTDTQELERIGDCYICGRVTAIRKAGAKLLFLEIVDTTVVIPGSELQIYISLDKLSSTSKLISKDAVKGFGKLVGHGDTIGIRGKPFRTSTGQLSLAASALPMILAPCLHMNVTDFGPNSDHVHDRYVRMRSNSTDVEVLRARSLLVKAFHDHFHSMNYINVQTPILAASAGGATARPFITTATEFPNRKLSLRVAPELWLKKLIVGGMQRIYEIGPAFRNEGIDKTHNPEFTTCEFYATYTGRSRLMLFTQTLIANVTRAIEGKIKIDDSFQTAIGTLSSKEFKSERPYMHLDFLHELRNALGVDLPNLSNPDAREDVLQIFRSKQIPIPSKPTLPRLLDKLCSTYIEPLCNNATWIVNPPECLSPLAKSAPHYKFRDQRVALSAELFIHRKEIVNCYEEENSPFEQRRKFVDQQRLARLPSNRHGKPGEDDDEAMEVDEDYIRALEWGMPPTGGWGCGIDRLLMLMLGKERIEDVLTFGNLRSVTWGAQRMQKEKSKPLEASSVLNSVSENDFVTQ